MKTSKKQTQYIIRDKNSNQYANIKYQTFYPDDNEIESHGFECDLFRATRYGSVQDAQCDIDDIIAWEEDHIKFCKQNNIDYKKVDLTIDEITYSAEIENLSI